MKLSKLTIKPVGKNKLKFRKTLETRIDAFNKSKAGPTRWAPLDLEVKNAKGKLVGGLIGYSYLGWLYVDILFIDKAYRGQDVGTQLLQKAESWAKKRGCRYNHLITFSFQAKNFYLKLGYKLYAQAGPFSKGHVKYYLMKKL